MVPLVTGTKAENVTKISNATTTKAAAATQTPVLLGLSSRGVVPSGSDVVVQDSEGKRSRAPQFGQNLESEATSIWHLEHCGNDALWLLAVRSSLCFTIAVRIAENQGMIGASTGTQSGGPPGGADLAK